MSFMSVGEHVGDRHVDFARFDRELHEEWTQFCTRAGLPTDRIPPLTREVLAAPSKFRNNALLNATATSLHRPINPYRHRRSPSEGEAPSFTATLYVIVVVIVLSMVSVQG